MRQPAVLLLRRASDSAIERDAGDLGRDDVHQHAGHQRRQAAGHVEPDPVDRHLAVGDPGARAEVGDDVAARARPRRSARSRRIDSSSPARTAGSSCREGVGERLARDPDVGLRRRRRTARGELEDRLHARGSRTASQIGMHRRDRRLDVEVGARHGGAVVDGAAAAPRRSMRRIMARV